VIVERLTRDRFRFHTNDDEQTPRTPHIPPTPTAAQHADWLEQRFGPVPLTLLSWVRLVGDVWLVGTHPEWPESASADPLVIQVEGSHYPDYPIQKHFTDEWEQWRKYTEKHPESRPFILDLAPDRLRRWAVSRRGEHAVRRVLELGLSQGRLSSLHRRQHQRMGGHIQASRRPPATMTPPSSERSGPGRRRASGRRASASQALCR
jgi:hypothetical protein